MSYPQPGPGNPNPYAQQQQPYGYPQPTPYPYGQPATGYPQQQMGYSAPMTMPGTVKAARAMLFTLGGLGVLGLVAVIIMLALVNNAAKQSPDASAFMAFSTGFAVVQGFFAVAIAICGFLLGAKVPNGGNGVRVGAIVYGAIMAVFGLLSILSIVGIIPLALGTMVVVFAANQEGQAWFNRPRY